MNDTMGARTSANTLRTASSKRLDLPAIDENRSRMAIHTVKPDNIATFLGRKLSLQFEGEMGSRFNIRIEGRESNTPWDRYPSGFTASSASFSGSRPRSTI
jgi:hypothetical protein